MNIERIKIRSLNEEVKKTLINYIKKMDLDKNNKLPREEMLADQIGVSRITLRSVLTELAQEGMIFRKHGKGTFVNSEVIQAKATFNPALEFDQLILNCGYKAHIDLVSLETVDAGAEIASKLQIEEDDKIIIVKKIAYADDIPAIFWIDRFPKKIIEGDILEKEINISIFEYFRIRAGRTIVRDVVKISTALSTEVDEFSQYMKNDKIKSLLVCDSVNFDENNESIIYGTVYYDTSIIKFILPRQMENVYNDINE